MASSWFFLSTLNYDARSTTHRIYIHVQSLPDLHNLKLCNFGDVSAPIFFPWRKCKQWDEDGGRVLLGDNAGGGVVMVRPIRFQCVGFRISIGPTCIYIYMKIRTYVRFRLGQNLFCAGPSVTKLLRKTCSVYTQRRNAEEKQLSRLLRLIFRAFWISIRRRKNKS